jgi:hypothetical protein
MNFYAMSYLWMFVMLCWEDLGNMKGISYMMGGRILTPLRKMGVNICCCQYKINESKRRLFLVYFS